MTYDLHIHSCLSPCGDNEMTVNNIVNMAMLKELDVIALTDHNSSKNCPAFMEAARRAGIRAIPGMEINTSEEIHAVCLFPTLEQAMDFDSYVFSTMPPVKNKPEIFCDQIIVDENDEPIGSVDTLLITASGVSYSELPELMEEYGGIFFPSHIDRSSNSLVAIMGGIPEDVEFPFYEFYHLGLYDEFMQDYPCLKGKPWLHNSDAHYLWDIAEPERHLDPRIEEVLRRCGLIKD